MIIYYYSCDAFFLLLSLTNLNNENELNSEAKQKNEKNLFKLICKSFVLQNKKNQIYFIFVKQIRITSLFCSHTEIREKNRRHNIMLDAMTCFRWLFSVFVMLPE